MASNAELQAQRMANVPRGVSIATQIFAARAENAELWDVEGRRYVDFAGGIAVLNAGHRHPKVIEAVKRQLDAYTHTAFQIVPYAPYLELAERLNELAPGPTPKKTLFVTTGAEALENAVKIARAATRRTQIIAFVGGFHGRTLMTMAMTGKVAPYKAGMGPMPGGVFHAPFPMPLHGVSEKDSLAAIEKLFKADVDPSDVAAIVIEPVQGEGGFYIAPPSFLKALRELCDRHGILLVADEVQTGFARTGKLFAMEHSGVEPDLMTVAKSLAGGFPLAGVIGKAEIMDAVAPGGLGGTYAGSPVACAAALAVLDAIEEEKLLDRADALGRRVTERLEKMAASNRFACIGEVRGLGAMVAFELVKDRTTNEPDAALTAALTKKALEKGLILLSCGLYGNVIRILVPLTASDAVVDEGMGIVEEALAELVSVNA